MRVEYYYLILIILFVAIISFHGFNIKKLSSNSNLLKIKNFNISYSKYQFESNPYHIYFINATINNFNFSLPSLYNVSSSVLGPISYYDNSIIVPLSSNNNNFNFSQYWGGVISINASNGKMNWIHYFNDKIMTQPIIYNGIIYVGLGSGYYDPTKYANGIVAINASNGKTYWTKYLDSEHMPTFLYYNITLLVAPGIGIPINNSTGIIYFLNASTGVVINKINLSSESEMSSILNVNNTAYFGAVKFNLSIKSLNYTKIFKNSFYAINLKTHSISWIDNFSSSLGMQDSSPVYSKGVIITGYTSSVKNATITLLGLDYENGSLIWRFTSPEHGNFTSNNIQLPPLTVYKDVVYSDSPSIGYLYAINASTGKFLWQFYTGPTSANVNIINNFIVILNDKGELYTVNLNGKLINKRNIGISAGPEDIIQIGDNIILYGDSNKIEIVPINFLFS